MNKYLSNSETDYIKINLWAGIGLKTGQDCLETEQ